jgi:hypothetical protein
LLGVQTGVSERDTGLADDGELDVDVVPQVRDDSTASRPQ